ncbi:MAG: MmgE/PrpD family protein [Burkholderiales bacterium]|nr:MmgE/PrpD family protein [Burkholderiales bacterium]
MNGITRTLAQYAACSQYDELPATVRHEGTRAFVNFLGCAAGGAREDVVETILPLLAEFDGGSKATVIGRRERLDTLNAALINSMSSGALSFNDTHYLTVAHPSSPAGAAALAIAERRPVSGRALIHGVILGIELQCRVGAILCTPPAVVSVGLSMQGLVGGIGAAVAAGKLMNLDADGMCRAIGHAINQCAGLREAHATMGSPFTPGHAARCGVFAALLAGRGVTIADSMIEGVKGFAVTYGQNAQPDAAVAELGSRFEILALAYKPYPSGFVTHPVIDVCLDLARREQFDAADIERVEIAVNPLTVQLCNRPEPKDRAQAMVSFQHWGAVALLHKAAGIAQVTQAMVDDPAVAALRRKFVAAPRADVAREAAQLRVVLKTGKVLAASVERCIGSTGVPLSDDDLSRKTLGQLESAYGAEASRRILEQAWRMADAPSAGALCELLKL